MVSDPQPPTLPIPLGVSAEGIGDGFSVQPQVILSGDFSSNTSFAVNDEIVLFADPSGKLGKRAVGTGIATLNGGRLGAITDNSTNWDAAYVQRNQWDGGSSALDPVAGRNSLGLGTAALGTVAQSIQQTTSNGQIITLVGDNVAPGNSKYYGTDPTGTKGFYSLPTVTTEGTWNYSTTTTMADPGSGKIRGNNASGSLVTQLAISRTANNGYDRQQLLRLLAVGDTISIQDQGNATNWLRYTVSTVPTDNGTWFLIPVTFVANGGSAPTNNTPFIVAFIQTGGGAAAVSSVFGRTGAIVSATGDYTFAQIGSKPTTLVGYGITDAEPALGNPGTSGQILSSTTGGVRSWVSSSSVGGVASVFGRLGAVVALVGDYSAFYQPLDADLTTWAGLTPSANFQVLVPHTFAQMRTDLGLGSAALNNTGDFEVPLTFSQSLARVTNTVTLSGDAASPGNNKQYGTNASGTKGWVAFASAQVVVSPNPTNITGTTQRMFGLGGTCKITPTASGKVLVIFTGNITLTVAGPNGFYNAYYGTGTAPINGATVPGGGTAWGSIVATNTLNNTFPTSMVAVITGLTVGTAYWFDVSALGGGATSALSFGNVYLTAVEFP